MNGICSSGVMILTRKNWRIEKKILSRCHFPHQISRMILSQIWTRTFSVRGPRLTVRTMHGQLHLYESCHHRWLTEGAAMGSNIIACTNCLGAVLRKTSATTLLQKLWQCTKRKPHRHCKVVNKPASHSADPGFKSSHGDGQSFHSFVSPLNKFWGSSWTMTSTNLLTHLFQLTIH